MKSKHWTPHIPRHYSMVTHFFLIGCLTFGRHHNPCWKRWHHGGRLANRNLFHGPLQLSWPPHGDECHWVITFLTSSSGTQGLMTPSPHSWYSTGSSHQNCLILMKVFLSLRLMNSGWSHYHDSWPNRRTTEWGLPGELCIRFFISSHHNTH